MPASPGDDMKPIVHLGANTGASSSHTAYVVDQAESLADAQTAAKAQHTAATIGARMDYIPASRQFWKIIFLVSLGGWFEYYDLIFTGYTVPGLTKAGL